MTAAELIDMPARFPVRIRQTVLAFPAQDLGLCPYHQHRYHCWLPACNCRGKSAAPTAHLGKSCGTRLSKLPKLLRPKMKRSRTAKPLGPSWCFLQEFQENLEVNCSEQGSFTAALPCIAMDLRAGVGMGGNTLCADEAPQKWLCRAL